jgi:hypothetical protein
MMQMPTRSTQTGWVTHRIHNPGNTPLGDNDRPRIKRRPTLDYSRNRYFARTLRFLHRKSYATVGIVLVE